MIAETLTPDGSRLSLQRHDGHFHMRVDGELLMSTRAWQSEAQMAELGCAGFVGTSPKRVLIGGLGFGFTLRRVLELVHPNTVVEVAELLPVMVKWNREHLLDVNGRLLDDSRVVITIADVFAVLRKAPSERYDAILLDIDNGPEALVDPRNERLYADDGLRMLSRTLAVGGRVVFWSASTHRGFMRRLSNAGFRAQSIPASAYPQAVRKTHTLFVADPRGGHTSPHASHGKHRSPSRVTAIRAPPPAAARRPGRGA
jgi:spermidine synthase